jgi:hypothetical protein
MLQEFVHRVGTFTMLIGVGILVLFIASASAGSPNFDYLFWSMLAGIIGLFLRQRRPPAAPSERFRLLKGLKRPRRGRRDQ